MLEILPIGSIVKLKQESNIDVMIVGYTPINKQEKKIYHYAGIQYPQGLSDKREIQMFYMSDIEKIVEKGYFTEEIEEVLKAVKEIIDTIPPIDNIDTFD